MLVKLRIASKFRWATTTCKCFGDLTDLLLLVGLLALAIARIVCTIVDLLLRHDELLLVYVWRLALPISGDCGQGRNRRRSWYRSSGVCRRAESTVKARCLTGCCKQLRSFIVGLD